MGWFKFLKLRNWVWWPPRQTPLTYQRDGDCMTSNAAAQFCWGDCMFTEGSSTWRGSQPRHIGDGSTDRAYHSNHECQSYCKRWGDGGDLHGYCDHLSGESDPKQPQTGDLSPGAYNTGHHGPGERSDQITTFGWWGESTTAFQWVSELITAFGWMGLSMTASGQREGEMPLGSNHTNCYL